MDSREALTVVAWRRAERPASGWPAARPPSGDPPRRRGARRMDLSAGQCHGAAARIFVTLT